MDTLRINIKQLRSIKSLLIPANFDFQTIPKSLRELEVWNLEPPLVPNWFPSQLKLLGIFKVLDYQEWNTPGIFPDAFGSLIIGYDENEDVDGEGYCPTEEALE